MKGNEFWPIVTELFPLVLGLSALIAAIRLTVSSVKQILGQEDSIEKAINDIVKGSITLFLVIPSVLLIWKVCTKLSVIVTAIVQKINF